MDVLKRCLQFNMNPAAGTTVVGRNGEIELLDEQNRVRARMNAPYGAVLKVGDGEEVETGQALYEWDPYSNVILTDRPGKIKFIDIIQKFLYLRFSNSLFAFSFCNFHLKHDNVFLGTQ